MDNKDGRDAGRAVANKLAAVRLALVEGRVDNAIRILGDIQAQLRQMQRTATTGLYVREGYE